MASAQWHEAKRWSERRKVEMAKDEVTGDQCSGSLKDLPEICGPRADIDPGWDPSMGLPLGGESQGRRCSQRVAYAVNPSNATPYATAVASAYATPKGAAHILTRKTAMRRRSRRRRRWRPLPAR